LKPNPPVNLIRYSRLRLVRGQVTSNVGLFKRKAHGVGFDGNGGGFAQEVDPILPGIGR
jgi:hypothetical protein